MKFLEGKVVVLGSHGVGKTSIVVRYVGKVFSTHISPTIGASFFTCKVDIGDTKVKLQIWDTAGQERFRSMTPMYYRNANAAILVFDITDQKSFYVMKTWVKELQSNVSETMILSIVGNKVDLEDDRQVSTSEGQDYASSIGAQYYESSAIEDQGIEQIFLNTATGLVNMGGECNSLKQYDYHEEYLTPTGKCSSLPATVMGKTETAPWSIESIAHGDAEHPYMCC